MNYLFVESSKSKIRIPVLNSSEKSTNIYIDKESGEYLKIIKLIHDEKVITIRYYLDDNDSYRYYVNGIAISKNEYPKYFW